MPENVFLQELLKRAVEALEAQLAGLNEERAKLAAERAQAAGDPRHLLAQLAPGRLRERPQLRGMANRDIKRSRAVPPQRSHAGCASSPTRRVSTVRIDSSAPTAPIEWPSADFGAYTGACSTPATRMAFASATSPMDVGSKRVSCRGCC